MQAEAGFTEADAGGEVRRCIQTLRLSGEEARRLAGDVIPLEGAPQQEGRLAFTLRVPLGVVVAIRSEEHTSELQSLMRISYAVFCLKKKKQIKRDHHTNTPNTMQQ